MTKTYNTLEEAITDFINYDPEYQGEEGLMRAYEDEELVSRFVEINYKGKMVWIDAESVLYQHYLEEKYD